LLLATLVGVSGGLGAGYLRQPQAASGGTATPLPAVSPSVPVDPPTTQPPFDEDIAYPALQPGLTFKPFRMGNSQQAWMVPVPEGWQAFTVSSSEPEQLVANRERSSYDELRFRPKGEPPDGGFSLRVKTVNAHLTPAAMVAAKDVAIEDIDVVDDLGGTEDSLKFTYRTTGNHLRYNYFQWFAARGQSEATLEMSVVGRERDVPGLDALFAAFESTLQEADEARASPIRQQVPRDEHPPDR
jgi:hypothetical protein